MLCIHLLVHVPLDAISEGEGSSIGSDGRVESALVLVGPFAHNSKFAYDYSILHVVLHAHDRPANLHVLDVTYRLAHCLHYTPFSDICTGTWAFQVSTFLCQNILHIFLHDQTRHTRKHSAAGWLAKNELKGCCFHGSLHTGVELVGGNFFVLFYS